jgi:tetratricopeptide (TPR) repeat protein
MSEARPPNLALAMLAAQRDRRSGVFDVLAKGVHTHVYFSNGRVVFVEQGSLGDTLGRVLVREGKLTDEQYAKVIERMTQRLVESEQMRFGEVVAELGFLSPDEVREALAVQVKDKAVHCLMHKDPEYAFEEGSDRVAAVGHFPSRVEPLILAATRLFESDRVDRILDVKRAAYPHVLGDASEHAVAFALGGAGQRILDRIDGATSVQELVSAARGAEDEARTLLAALVVGGAVELRTTPSGPAKPESRDARAPDSEEALWTLTASGRRKAKVATVLPQPRPATAAAPGRAPTPSVVVPTPLDPRLVPRLLDPRAAHVVGEEAFQKAKAYLRRDALAPALAHLKRAVDLCPDAVEFGVYAAWVEFCSSEGEEARRSAKAVAQELAESATKAEPNLAFGFYVLGYVAMLDGDDKRAVRHFRQALRLDDSLVDAERHLRLLVMRGQGAPQPSTSASEPPPGSEPPPAAASPARRSTVAASRRRSAGLLAILAILVVVAIVIIAGHR